MKWQTVNLYRCHLQEENFSGHIFAWQAYGKQVYRNAVSLTVQFSRLHSFQCLHYSKNWYGTTLGMLQNSKPIFKSHRIFLICIFVMNLNPINVCLVFKKQTKGSFSQAYWIKQRCWYNLPRRSCEELLKTAHSVWSTGIEVTFSRSP